MNKKKYLLQLPKNTFETIRNCALVAPLVHLLLRYVRILLLWIYFIVLARLYCSYFILALFVLRLKEAYIIHKPNLAVHTDFRIFSCCFCSLSISQAATFWWDDRHMQRMSFTCARSQNILAETWAGMEDEATTTRNVNNNSEIKCYCLKRHLRGRNEMKYFGPEDNNHQPIWAHKLYNIIYTKSSACQHSSAIQIFPHTRF